MTSSGRDLVFIPLSEFRRTRNMECSPVQRTRLFATLCRVNTLYMIKRAGSGHIGSSFSSLDIVSWLFLNELRILEKEDQELPHDIYFSSKGHDVPGLYSVLTALGLIDFDLLHKLRRLDGLPGHPDISIPFIETNTGSLGMGISKAKGMAIAHRLQGKTTKIYVMTGDGELQEGQIWESLSSAVNLGLHEITVIVDHNKIQSDTWVSKVSDLGDIESKFGSFGWYVARCNGNNLEAFSSTLACCKAVEDRPKAIIADTSKGAGVSFMAYTAFSPEEAFYPFHSGAPDDDVYIQAVEELITSANRQLSTLGEAPLQLETRPYSEQVAPSRSQCLIPVYAEALVEQGERQEHLVVLDADLVKDCGLAPFRERFPDRFFECGIAEQDMVSQAGGMALKGLLPIVHSFACFLSSRSNEQIYNNATEGTKIIYVGSLAGLLPGGPGHSHQSVRDISALAAVPGLLMIEPFSEKEVSLALDFCINSTPKSCYLRLVSIPCEIPFELPAEYRLEPGRGLALTEGRDAVLFSYGPVMLSQAFQAARKLSSDYGIGVKVINLPWLNQVDIVWLNQTVKSYPWVFTLDNHYVIGGQGQLIVSRLAETSFPQSFQARRLGVVDFPVCGQDDEVLRFHRLDGDSLVQEIVKAIRNRPLQ